MKIEAWKPHQFKAKAKPLPAYLKLLKTKNPADIERLDRALGSIESWYGNSGSTSRRKEFYDSCKILASYFSFDPYIGPTYRFISIKNNYKKFKEGQILNLVVANPVASSWTTSLSNAIRFGDGDHGIVVSMRDVSWQIANSQWIIAAAKTIKSKAPDKYLKESSDSLLDVIAGYHEEDEVMLSFKKKKVKVRVEALILDKIVRPVSAH